MTSTNTAAESPVQFRCNICGAENEQPSSVLAREVPSCSKCGSTVRTRAIIRMLSLELFGVEIVLPDFPVLKSVRVVGMSDSADYAARLGEKFDYRNTEYDREPRLDIVHPPEREMGRFDFIISSEVLEHVVAPVEVAFANLHRMLKSDGVLLLTVPYELSGSTVEHFGPMDAFGFARVGDRTVLVRRSDREGYEVFDNLVFHGGPGSTLEMRVFTEPDLRRQIEAAGFSSVQIYSDPSPALGVFYSSAKSLPVAARKGDPSLDREAVRSWAEQWQEAARNKQRIIEVQRTAQAHLDALEGELKARTEWGQRLDAEIAERTEWAISLERELREREAATALLQQELEEARAQLASITSELNGLRRQLFIRAARRLGLLR